MYVYCMFGDTNEQGTTGVIQKPNNRGDFVGLTGITFKEFRRLRAIGGPEQL